MVYKCCVPGCNSNYDNVLKDNNGQYVSMFRFPREKDRIEQWKKNIHRDLKTWTPKPSSRVCERHFESKFISRIEVVTDKYGNIIAEVPRQHPILEKSGNIDPIPTIFPNLPAYLSTKLPSERTTERTEPSKRRKLMEDRYEEAVNEFLGADVINGYENFAKKAITYIPEEISEIWKFNANEKRVLCYILNVDTNDYPEISVCVKVDCTMRLTVLKNGFILREIEKIRYWSEFETILRQFKCGEEGPKSVDCLKSTVISCFEQLLEKDLEDDVLEKLGFLKEQFQLVFENRYARRYSPKLIVQSFMIHNQSSAAYDALQQNFLLTLPSTRHLRQLSRGFNISVDDKDGNVHFLKHKCASLIEREKYVVLQIDEIYVKKKIDFKNGKIYGYAENTAEVTPAKTIVAFLISSAYGHFKEIAALHPVSKIDGNQLTTITKETCSLIQQCGFKIVVIISDNNRINRKLFDNLSVSSNNNFTTTIHQEFRTFLTFDSVHLLKSIRNNWINQAEKTFVYPNFNDFNLLCMAKWEVLSEIYAKESGFLVKSAPKLNFKTVSPSNIERQKVSLALNVFDESTIAAVKQHTGTDNDPTASFLELIWRWFSIMNIKNKLVHILKRKNISRPFESLEDDRFEFLYNFLKWLESWKPVPKNS